MPLIYGKTNIGFSEDLKEIQNQKGVYPNQSDLLKLSNLIIKTLKNNSALKKVNQFMVAMRALAGLLHYSGDLVILGPYSSCQICYHKENITRVRVYQSKSKDKHYKVKQVSITNIAHDDLTNQIKS